MGQTKEKEDSKVTLVFFKTVILSHASTTKEY